ncbi:2-phospho-L-lactate guanylyltransferase [Agromyces ramosus]|uniref:2-phospho-L-lactate guanylyltransferase n=1 Tax=Agromyces ramosus TaxID=33879 RepID=UPI0027D7EBB8|nr:2-phospho-L-lactate guanylyltransferase [Agromyces ramosus]
MRWSVVIPVKGPAEAKTRLAASVPPTTRVELARAFALDTIAAALAARRVSRVIVVGDDASLAGGADYLAEPQERQGLPAAIRHGIDHARSTEPVPVAVLLGDLPALTPDELDAALDAAVGHPLAFVRDADGTGTTLATAMAGIRFEPRFGLDSAALHAAAGYVELEASAGLIHDVDTVDGLAEALALGVGRHTHEVVERSSLRPG